MNDTDETVQVFWQRPRKELFAKSLHDQIDYIDPGEKSSRHISPVLAATKEPQELCVERLIPHDLLPSVIPTWDLRCKRVNMQALAYQDETILVSDMISLGGTMRPFDMDRAMLYRGGTEPPNWDWRQNLPGGTLAPTTADNLPTYEDPTGQVEYGGGIGIKPGDVLGKEWKPLKQKGQSSSDSDESENTTRGPGLSASETHVTYFVAGIFALASFMFPLIRVDKLCRLQNPVKISQEPLTRAY